MKIVDFLQGKWLGHPVHPAVVHLPAGLWPVACVLDLVARTGAGGGNLELLAVYCVGFGLIGALAAIPTGAADWAGIKQEKPAWKLGLYHMVLNLLATAVWSVNFGLRLVTFGQHVVTLPVLVTSVAGTLLVLTGGYLGGLLVFDHGISVARLSKKKWRRIAVHGGARVPDEKQS